MRKLVIIFFLSIIASRFSTVATAQILEIKPLFEYPVAPEELESLEDKCNYIVKNFWNGFDFKSKQPIDQYALNEAFQVYATSFRFASDKEVDNSVDKLIKNISSNPVMLLQFCKAAEENLYGPRAEFWSDYLYLKFLDAAIKNKKINKDRKLRFQTKANAINSSLPGKQAPSFWFEDKERASKQYFPMSTPTLLIFGNPEDTDWRLERIKMDSNTAFTDALEKGKINVLYIVTQEPSNWQESVSNYNKRWVVGKSDNVSEVYDIRLNPCIYIVGSDGKILRKNVLPSESIYEILELVN